ESFQIHVARHDHFRDGRHTDAIATEDFNHPIFGEGFESWTGEAEVNTVLDIDFKFVCDFFSQMTERWAVRLAHIYETRTEPFVVLSAQWMLGHEVDVVLDDYYRPDFIIRIHAT